MGKFKLYVPQFSSSNTDLIRKYKRQSFWKQILYSKFATIVEGHQKAPFLIVVGEGATSFPPLLHCTLDMYLILVSVKLGGIKYHF